MIFNHSEEQNICNITTICNIFSDRIDNKELVRIETKWRFFHINESFKKGNKSMEQIEQKRIE